MPRVARVGGDGADRGEEAGEEEEEGGAEEQGKDEEIGEMISQDTDIFLENAIGETFSRVLEDSGIYKKTEEGKKGFKKFIDYINKN